MRQVGSLSAGGTVSEAREGSLRTFPNLKGESRASTTIAPGEEPWSPERERFFLFKNAGFAYKWLSKHEEKADNRIGRLGCQPET